jgi:lipopolysaccharide biosynthesis protein
MSGWSDALRRARRSMKAKLPFVRRREYRLLRARHDALIDALIAHPRRAADARIRAVKPVAAGLAGEICLFVSHAASPALKPHVMHHARCLAEFGFAVVLIVNAEGEAESVALDTEFLERLAGAYVRENVGFDFGGWGHGWALGGGFPGATRLLLVNDSIVGPVDRVAFAGLLERLRSSAADVVGLTWNFVPHPHVQSFFLAFAPRALAAPVLRSVLGGMHALPTKELVVDAYETALTRQLVAAGLEVSALFQPRYHDPRSGDDTLLRWRELLDAGFPFVKASLLRAGPQAERTRACVPSALLPREEGV